MGKLVAVLYGIYFVMKSYLLYTVHFTDLSTFDSLAVPFALLMVGAGGSGFKLVVLASLALDIAIIRTVWIGEWDEARKWLRYYVVLLLFVIFVEPIIDYAMVDVAAVAASEAANLFMVTLGRFGRFTLLIFYAFLYGGLYLATFIAQALERAR